MSSVFVFYDPCDEYYFPGLMKELFSLHFAAIVSLSEEIESSLGEDISLDRARLIAGKIKAYCEKPEWKKRLTVLSCHSFDKFEKPENCLDACWGNHATVLTKEQKAKFTEGLKNCRQGSPRGGLLAQMVQVVDTEIKQEKNFKLLTLSVATGTSSAEEYFDAYAEKIRVNYRDPRQSHVYVCNRDKNKFDNFRAKTGLEKAHLCGHL